MQTTSCLSSRCAVCPEPSARERAADVEMRAAPTYAELTRRNAGYVPAEVQEKIRTTRILIAGCGVGSTIAEAAARIGFTRFVLADGDSVEPHNLNRQAYAAEHVGARKVHALAERLRGINPQGEIRAFDGWVNAESAPRLVAECDLIFDTVDFLDLAGIVALHDEAHRQGKPIVSAVSAGWGATAVYFPAHAKVTFRRLFGLSETGAVENDSYVARFAKVIERLKGVLMPEVVEAMGRALKIMQDGRPCPAPHVSVGAAAVAALAVTAAVRVLAGLPVAEAPRMMVADLGAVCRVAAVDLAD